MSVMDILQSYPKLMPIMSAATSLLLMGVALAATAAVLRSKR